MPRTSTGTEYQSFGPEGAPCVVLIHGLGLNHACWQWMVPALAGKYHVVSYDLMGHGVSDRSTKTPSLDVFCDQLRDLLDTCSVGSAAIVGFSMGGMIARRFAHIFPERTDALVILNSPHTRSDAAQAAIAHRVQQARHSGADATVADAIERWFSPSFQTTHPKIIAMVKSWVLNNSRDVYHLNYSVLAEEVPLVVEPQPPIVCPTLVMTADEDHGNGPEMARAIAAEINGARTVILKGLRHMALAEDPDAVNAPVTEFLDALLYEGKRV